MTDTVPVTQAYQRAAANARRSGGEVVLHGSDWIALTDAILALHPPVMGEVERAPDWTIERDANGEAMVCTGCGTTRTLDHIRYISPTALSCCPERKMVPVRERLATPSTEQVR